MIMVHLIPDIIDYPMTTVDTYDGDVGLYCDLEQK